MDRFTIINDADVIVSSGGVFKQAKVFVRGSAVYCQYGSGFVRLYAGGATGLPKMRWDDIDIPGVQKAELVDAGFGKLSVPRGKLIEQK